MSNDWSKGLFSIRDMLKPLILLTASAPRASSGHSAVYQGTPLPSRKSHAIPIKRPPPEVDETAVINLDKPQLPHHLGDISRFESIPSSPTPTPSKAKSPSPETVISAWELERPQREKYLLERGFILPNRKVLGASTQVTQPNGSDGSVTQTEAKEDETGGETITLAGQNEFGSFFTQGKAVETKMTTVQAANLSSPGESRSRLSRFQSRPVTDASGCDCNISLYSLSSIHRNNRLQSISLSDFPTTEKSRCASYSPTSEFHLRSTIHRTRLPTSLSIPEFQTCQQSRRSASQYHSISLRISFSWSESVSDSNTSSSSIPTVSDPTAISIHLNAATSSTKFPCFVFFRWVRFRVSLSW